ncbi:uncharacterized protein BXZ73DRAFT_80352 [Epithele typhae]|uniref:uncharacterized protein n=1 Tax=Epithele typhae TaxID=378194 RepID=UPI0020084D3B|nr:uncharacterized protein BXZ73DRAFT_80352 [Epithele typhae]KAH9919482.1 hypothetical protein BXZ73DRAFT_80352 [Epithele typhae]
MSSIALSPNICSELREQDKYQVFTTTPTLLVEEHNTTARNAVLRDGSGETIHVQLSENAISLSRCCDVNCRNLRAGAIIKVHGMRRFPVARHPDLQGQVNFERVQVETARSATQALIQTINNKLEELNFPNYPAGYIAEFAMKVEEMREAGPFDIEYMSSLVFKMAQPPSPTSICSRLMNDADTDVLKECPEVVLCDIVRHDPVFELHDLRLAYHVRVTDGVPGSVVAIELTEDLKVNGKVYDYQDAPLNSGTLILLEKIVRVPHPTTPGVNAIVVSSLQTPTEIRMSFERDSIAQEDIDQAQAQARLAENVERHIKDDPEYFKLIMDSIEGMDTLSRQ